jgi:hypothetical protein
MITLAMSRSARRLPTLPRPCPGLACSCPSSSSSTPTISGTGRGQVRWHRESVAPRDLLAGSGAESRDGRGGRHPGRTGGGMEKGEVGPDAAPSTGARQQPGTRVTDVAVPCKGTSFPVSKKHPPELELGIRRSRGSASEGETVQERIRITRIEPTHVEAGAGVQPIQNVAIPRVQEVRVQPAP